MKNLRLAICLLLGLFTSRAHVDEVMEFNEVRLNASNDYNNPYRDVDLWVTLSGPLRLGSKI